MCVCKETEKDGERETEGEGVKERETEGEVYLYPKSVESLTYIEEQGIWNRTSKHRQKHRHW